MEFHVTLCKSGVPVGKYPLKLNGGKGSAESAQHSTQRMISALGSISIAVRQIMGFFLCLTQDLVPQDHFQTLPCNVQSSRVQLQHCKEKVSLNSCIEETSWNGSGEKSPY